MKRVIKGLIIYLSSLFFLVFLCPDRLRGEVVDLEFEGESLSANLNRAPLQRVLDKISKEKGFWFKGGASSFEEKVSAQFTDLSLEDALKRILVRCNYSLLFNKNKALVGAIIIGQRTCGLAMAEGRHVRTEEMIRFQEDDKLTGFTEPLDVFRSDFPPDGPMEGTEEAVENRGVVQKAPIPGKPVEIIEEEPENLDIITGPFSPSEAVEVAEEEVDNFTATANCPPPGG